VRQWLKAWADCRLWMQLSIALFPIFEWEICIRNRRTLASIDLDTRVSSSHNLIGMRCKKLTHED
jgi:hypothetical protein